jgi:hypothetical protein
MVMPLAGVYTVDRSQEIVVGHTERKMTQRKQSPTASQNSPASLLPARHPRLRDTAVFLAILSTICYFAFSEGVRSFVGFLLMIFARLVHASH